MLTAIFGVFEISKFICGFIVAKRCDQVNSAKWYGKLNTVVIYITMILLILFPNISSVWAGALMLVCGSVISVASSFFFGTGILIIGAAAIIEALNLPSYVLNLFLYGSSVNACLSSNVGTLIVCILVSAMWTVIYNLVGTHILNKSDVY